MTSRSNSYGLAVLTTGMAWLLDLLLQGHLAESSAALYIAAALISTWFGGFGPGLLAIVLTALINLIFSNDPYLSLAVGVHGFDRLVLITALAFILNLIRRNQLLLKGVNSRLEEKVKARTTALDESNQKLEAFCYTLAHDLRAPLRAIQGFTEVMLADHGAEFDQNMRVGMERVRNAAERMGRLILDLLAYTDLTRADFRRQPVDLHRICDKLRSTYADELTRTNAKLAVHLEAHLVLGDPAGVERALVNLLANALKFTRPAQPPVVRIYSQRRVRDVRVCVEDNGIGLDPKYCDRVFGIFERLGPAEDSDDTGVGLAIVKRSIEKMGGNVGVESTPGEGSCFWFELPEAQTPVTTDGRTHTTSTNTSEWIKGRPAQPSPATKDG